MKNACSKNKCSKKKAEIKCTNVNAPTIKQQNDGDSFSDSMSTNNNANVIQPELSLNISRNFDSASTSNQSPVYENCEIHSEEIYENILQDSMKTNDKEKNKEAMSADFASSTPCKPAQACTKKEEFVQGIVQAACYGIISSAVDNMLRKGFDEQAEIIGLCDKVKQSLPKSKNFNGCDSLKKIDLLTDTVENGIVSNTPYVKEESDTEKVTPSNDKSIFEEVGINHETAESLSNSKLCRNKYFESDMDKASCSVSVCKEWHKIPILQKKGYRSLGGNWKELCLNYIKVKNPFCVWKFTSNFVKKETSRKQSSSYFMAKAKCTHSVCTCKVIITQNIKNAKEIKLEFYGNVRHDTTKPKSRQIKGEGRKNMNKIYNSSFYMNLSDMYREGLSSIPSEQFFSGNRDGAAQSKKVHQNIKHEALHEINSFDNIHKIC